MNFSIAPNNGLGLMGSGVALWLVGAILTLLVPALAPVGAILVLVGQVLFWVGLILLLILLARSFFAD